MKTKLRYAIFSISIFGGNGDAGMCQVISIPPVKADAAEQVSYQKDLDVRQIPMSQIETGQPANDGRSQAVTTTLNRSDGKYKHGDSLILTVKTTVDAYIWVFDTGTSGKVHQIFPNRHEKDNFSKLGGNL